MNQRSGWQQPAAKWQVPPRQQQQQQRQAGLPVARNVIGLGPQQAGGAEPPQRRHATANSEPAAGHCYRNSAPINSLIRPRASPSLLDSPSYQTADRLRSGRFVVHRKLPVSGAETTFDEGAAAAEAVAHRIDIGAAYAADVNKKPPTSNLVPYREDGLNNNDINNNNNNDNSNNNLPPDCLAQPLAMAQINGTKYDWPAPTSVEWLPSDRPLSQQQQQLQLQQQQANAIILDSPRCSTVSFELSPGSSRPRRHSTFDLEHNDGNSNNHNLDDRLPIGPDAVWRSSSCACFECCQSERNQSELLFPNGRDGNSFSDEDFCCAFAESPEREIRFRVEPGASSLEANHRNWRAHSTMSSPAGRIQTQDRLDASLVGAPLVDPFGAPPVGHTTPLGERLTERLVVASPAPQPPLVVMRHPSQHQLRPLAPLFRPGEHQHQYQQLPPRQAHWSLPASPVISGANGGGGGDGLGARLWPAHHYEDRWHRQAGIVRPALSQHHQGHLSSGLRNETNNNNNNNNNNYNNNDHMRTDENYAPPSCSSNHANEWDAAAGWPNESEYLEQNDDEYDDEVDRHYDHDGGATQDEGDDDAEHETEALALVPKQAKGRLPLSVAEQMSEQAAKFVQEHPNCQPPLSHGPPGVKQQAPGQPGRSKRHSSRSQSLAASSNGRTSADWTGVRSNLQVRRTFRVKVRKSRPILGIAIEGGFNVSGQLIPRIVCVHEKGAAYQCGKLRASDLILEVNGISTVNMTHDAIASTIANAYYQDERPYIEFLVGESVQVRGACNDNQDAS